MCFSMAFIIDPVRLHGRGDARGHSFISDPVRVILSWTAVQPGVLGLQGMRSSLMAYSWLFIVHT